MEFSIKTLSPETAKTGCVVLGVYSEKELTPSARRVDQRSRGGLRAALADLSGKLGSTLLLRALPNVAAERLLLVCLGAKKEFGETADPDAVGPSAYALPELAAETVSHQL